MHVELEVIVYAMLGLVRLRLPLMGPFARQLGFPTGWWGRQITNGLNIFNRAVIDGSIEALAVRPGEHIADIGFGGGHGLRILLDRVHEQGCVYGIDPSPTMVATAQKRFEKALEQQRLQLIQAPMREMPFEHGVLDGIATVNTIYYIPDDELVTSLSELGRVLRPGGRLVVGAADPSYIEAAPWRNGLINRPTAQVIEFIQRAGFTIHEDRRIGESERAFHVYVASTSATRGR
ncbi:class I SAM-dependent methyltransferase [Nocardia brasiliensis]|uniref:class I SAM-dependent methyltransferase n=1 Tax=Nocardia brasiliensis TaxID=37326 RepID=UPI0024553B31|nr:class I SAM-dependent methyltransferase [Nocardia brasiliensis]